uniref:NADH-ubiquinone oxidoreductase chain 3 n=1 Tax=Clavelina oblonga TaxID=286222 RepID=A0A024FSM0_9ASCI|nr:NADH dehydrogenase subunit 3 [Clavelina oblonga]CAL24380.1 NADH dehydrogenase subunit 3 [Clavelina oblonga]
MYIFFWIFFFLILLTYLGFNMMKGELQSMFIIKQDTYECGYGELLYTQSFYTMQFFLIALSFMLFDLEIIFVLPFIFSEIFGFFSFLFIIIFLTVLMVGLLFEFKMSKLLWV